MTLYSENLLLRTTAVWTGGFRDAVAIPHRYGETRGALIQYSADRRTFVWADHPCVAIDAVYIDEQETSAFTWRNGIDSTGRAVCFVEIESAPADSSTVTALGRGKRSTVTGNLITNPAEVLYDLLANIAGKPVTTAMLDPFKRDCEALGLAVAGSFDDGTLSVQGAARQLCSSVGAYFAADALGLAFFEDAGVPLETVDARHDLAARAELANLVNDLTLRFDFDGSEPRQTIQMEVPTSVAAHGRRAQTQEARWLTSGRLAAAVATRLLQRASRPLWAVSVQSKGRAGTISNRRLRIGDTVRLDHALLPIEGAYRITSRSVDLDRGTTSIGFQVPAGPVPSVALMRQSSRLSAQTESTASATVSSDNVEIVIVEPGTDKPSPQAKVTLNKTYERTADAAGVARFPRSWFLVGRTNLLEIVSVDGRTSAMELQL
jgi:hypothetical protein